VRASTTKPQTVPQFRRHPAIERAVALPGEKNMTHNFISTSALATASVLIASLPVLAIDLPVHGSGRGGPFRVACPGGSFMTGFDGRTGAWIDQFRIVCASFDPNAREMVNPRPVNVTIGISGGGGPSSASCPGGWAISGINYQETKGDGPTNVGHSIGFTCAATVGPEIVARHFGPTTAREDRTRSTGFGQSFGSADFAPSICPGGEFAIGLYGRSGKFVDAVGLICVPLPAAAPPPQAAAPAPQDAKPLRLINLDRVKKQREEKEAAEAKAALLTPEGFTGTWTTKTDKNWSYTMTFIQDGREVNGTYVAQDGSKGRIKGRFGANILEFNWDQDGGYSGTGQFALAADGKSFNGVYRAKPHPKLTDPNYLQGTWSGTRR
jgi:hypothetical protein